MKAKLIAIRVPTVEVLPKEFDVNLLREVLRRMGLKVSETSKYLIFHNDGMNGLYDKASREIKTWGHERLDVSHLKRVYSEELAKRQGAA
jgi:hypothetical protein